jgi:plastocyanin
MRVIMGALVRRIHSSVAGNRVFVGNRFLPGITVVTIHAPGSMPDRFHFAGGTMSRVPRHRALALLCTAAVAVSACSSNDSSNPGTGSGGNTVTALASLAFSPTSVSIHPGDSVTWTFQSVGHTVTFDAVTGVPANIGSVSDPQANVSVTRTFANAGTYTYHCSIHSSMTGTITVSANDVISPPPPAPPPPPPPAGYSPAVSGS